jgi:hypothetical protein
MKAKLLMSTAVLALALGANGAFAQTRSDDSNHDRAPHMRNNDRMERQTTGQSSTSGTHKAQDDKAAPSQKSGDSNAANEKNAAPSTNAQSGSDNQSKAAQSSSSTSPRQSAAPQNKDAAASKDAASNKDAQNKSVSPSKDAAKSNTASDTATKNTAQPSSAQQNDPKAATTNQAASPKAESNSTRQSSNDPNAQNATRISASLKAEDKTKLSSAVAKLDAKPVTNVNFSVSVGTAVPTSVSLRPVPETIVEIVPQYRGYNFFVVRDEVVIVEPRTHKIVDVIERRGGSAHASSTTRERIKLSDKQRSYIRQRASSRKTTTTTTTTGSAPRSRTIVVGEEVPESVVIEEFPEEVYREVPAVRSYRYIRSGGGVYLVEPGSRRVIEEIE